MRAYDTVHATRSPKRNTLDIRNFHFLINLLSASRRKHFRTALAPTDTQKTTLHGAHSTAKQFYFFYCSITMEKRCEHVSVYARVCSCVVVSIRKKSRGVKSCCWCGKAKAKQSTQRASGPAAVAISGGGSLHRARRGTHRQHRRAKPAQAATTNSKLLSFHVGACEE